MTTPSMTEYLLSSPEATHLHQQATQCRFLELAGQGRLSRDDLSQWLSQDRLYAQAYIRFIGGLISRVQLPTHAPGEGTACTLQWRVFSLLQAALLGVSRELLFFEETARKYGLDLAALGPVAEGGTATQEYIDLFDSFTAQPRGDRAKTLMDGLVLLWGTERVYLDAWSYAKRQNPEHEDASQDLDGGALRKEFIPNWTSEEFHSFVRECQEVVDAYAASQSAETKEAVDVNATSLFRKVLVVEKAFWPSVD
ncbi:heme oxygenase-like protein [Xylariaceae sp. FL0662B]|nr:heme oxygenase-like protein [Xylariaceae sp. FL0662B]